MAHYAINRNRLVFVVSKISLKHPKTCASSINLFTRLNFSQQSTCIGVDLLSYDSKLTYKQEQYDWKAENFLDG